VKSEKHLAVKVAVDLLQQMDDVRYLLRHEKEKSELHTVESWLTVHEKSSAQMISTPTAIARTIDVTIRISIRTRWRRNIATTIRTMTTITRREVEEEKMAVVVEEEEEERTTTMTGSGRSLK
jgi:hypothetical protein